MTEVAHLPRLSSGAQRMRRYRESTNRIKQMTGEQLEAAVELLQGMIDAKLAGASAKLLKEVA
jgi:hypothetical protein